MKELQVLLLFICLSPPETTSYNATEVGQLSGTLITYFKAHFTEKFDFSKISSFLSQKLRFVGAQKTAKRCQIIEVSFLLRLLVYFLFQFNLLFILPSERSPTRSIVQHLKSKS